LVLCAAALLIALVAHAGSFTANPIRLIVPAGANSTSLTLDNTGDQPVLVQAQVVEWSQRDGQDVLTPSRDLIVSPPIFRIAAGASQIVRVGLLRAAPAERELTYRLFLQEVPPPRAAGEPGVAVALRLGLPVFVQPRTRAAPQLQWNAKAEREGITLSLTNSGNAHVQALDCKLLREDGTLFGEQQLAAYVLPGQTRSWLIKTSQPWRGEKLRLTAQTATGPVSAEIAPN
jgi:fimbrial chaperone protein